MVDMTRPSDFDTTHPGPRPRPNRDKTNRLLAGKHVRGPRGLRVCWLGGTPEALSLSWEGKNGFR